ncbi:hypothetical protein LWI28_018496 [Acer negundo]|uniref:PGG domain-containing protein n=1 Tax=Acer negundo TaxID=4023 RepID=A0AAD5JC51_ACENE|nr:hypothetical protein LWI28_018496 [Acer negundo]
MAFQVAVNPPGGVWQDDTPSHMAGKSIFFHNYSDTYTYFMICDTTGFLASLSIILLLISGLPIGRKFFMWILMVIMWIAISAMSFTYALAISSLSNLKSMYNAVRFVIIAGIGLMGLLVLVHTILLIVKMIKYVKKSIRQRRQPSGNMA